MDLRTEIVRNEERGLAIRVDVCCPLNAQFPEQLRNRVIPRHEFYLLGIPIVAKQTGVGFTLSTRGSPSRRDDDDRLHRVVCAMRDKALEIYTELSRLLKLSADIDALTTMGLGSTLMTTMVDEVIALKDQVKNLEDLAQDNAMEDLESPYDPIDEGEDDALDEGEDDAGDESHGIFVITDAFPDDSFGFRLMGLFNRLGQTALYATVIGLVTLAVLNLAGVI